MSTEVLQHEIHAIAVPVDPEHLTSVTPVPTWMVRLATWALGGSLCFAGGVVLILLNQSFAMKGSIADLQIHNADQDRTLTAHTESVGVLRKEMDWMVQWAKSRSKQ